MACQHGHMVTAELLIAKGANVEAKSYVRLGTRRGDAEASAGHAQRQAAVESENGDKYSVADGKGD